MGRRLVYGALSLILPAALACAFLSPAGPHRPVRFTETPAPHGADRYPNWPAPPLVGFEQLRLVETTPYEVREVDCSVGGTTGVEKMHLSFQTENYGDVVVKVKRVPEDLDGMNNAPRKELAAYAIQHLFLDPEDYVVPSTVLYCVPLERWREHHPSDSPPTLADTNCVLVVLAYWLKDVTLPEPLYDAERFVDDPDYAYFLSNFNLLTYLIDHRDGRRGNFLVSKNDARRQVFTVDNGSTFGPLGWNYFVPNWNVVRVAAVRRESVERLRALRRPDLDLLLVVAQLETGADGILRLVPSASPIDPDRGAHRHGGTLQFGLTRGETDDVWERIQRLLAEVDSGELPVF
jgi:hypothetical protein